MWLRRIASRRGAVDRELHGLALGDRPRGDLHVVGHEATRDEVLGVGDTRDGSVRAGQRPDVAHLSAGLGVERGAIADHQHRARIRVRACHALAADDDREDGRTRRQVFLPAGELGVAVVVEHLACDLDGRDRGTALGLVRLAGPGPLLVHAAAEVVEVHRPAAFRGDLARQVHGESQRVVEEEGALARHVALVEHVREHVLAALERPQEPLLLATHDRGHEVVLGLEVRVGDAHGRGGGVDECRRDERARTEAVRVPHGAPDDAPEHVPTLLVARDHAVGDEKGHRAGMLGEDAQRDVRFGAGERSVPGAGHRFRGGEERAEDVDVPDRVDPLEHREVALQTGAGVHAGRRQRDQAAVRLGVELHEHEIPDLDETVLADGWAAVGPELRTEVPEDLRARSAGPGVGHAPEVVLTEALDPVARHADRLAPDRLGLVVGLVHRDPEAIRVHAEDLGVELPCERDRLGLPVVAEAEVAEHLEEREMPVGPADVVEVVVLPAGADTLLDRGGAGVGRRLLADEVRLERHHARDGEENALVVRDQARARDDGVPARGEEVEKGAPKLVRGDHSRNLTGAPEGEGEDQRRTYRASPEPGPERPAPDSEASRRAPAGSPPASERAEADAREREAKVRISGARTVRRPNRGPSGPRRTRKREAKVRISGARTVRRPNRGPSGPRRRRESGN